MGNSVSQAEKDVDRTAPAVALTSNIAAQRQRLESLLTNGPLRRMAQDQALGWGAQRADELQAAGYRRQLAALGLDEVAEPDTLADAGLGLDRIEHND